MTRPWPPVQATLSYIQSSSQSHALAKPELLCSQFLQGQPPNSPTPPPLPEVLPFFSGFMEIFRFSDFAPRRLVEGSLPYGQVSLTDCFVSLFPGANPVLREINKYLLNEWPEGKMTDQKLWWQSYAEHLLNTRPCVGHLANITDLQFTSTLQSRYFSVLQWENASTERLRQVFEVTQHTRGGGRIWIAEPGYILFQMP